MSLAHGRSSNPGQDSETLLGEKNYITGYPAIVRDGVVSVVVEIPAGTNQKWEVSADGTSIHWEIMGEKPRIVKYLPYPGNYGMVPRTRLSVSQGGDGDPLDVIILGPVVFRGAVVEVRPIAVLELLDTGEQDDKILAVPLSGPFSDVTGLKSLNKQYPGATEIIRLWFSNYKGDKVQAKGYKGSKSAWKVIDAAASNFANEITDHL